MIYYFPLLSIYVSFSYRFLCWIDSNTCRLGFYGKLIEIIDGNDPTQLQRIKIFKIKQKEGLIDRVCSITQLPPSFTLFEYIYIIFCCLIISLPFSKVMDDYTVIGKNLFKKETDMNLFVGLKVTLTSTGMQPSILHPSMIWY